jgi:hypothetical protein
MKREVITRRVSMPRKTIGTVIWDDGGRETIYIKGGALLMKIEAICDFCGRKKEDCSPYRGALVCQGCQDEVAQARKIIAKAAKVKLYQKMGGRLA